ncbi:MAG: hypothetical protein PF517_19430 [Salinivirgaceae bacterium]|jgi:thiamine pyrophosphate-dependent acetolactate synthase large subunit-like protein|nr:hypothetical protein [Salinivirgaceae bacterium]
MYRLKKLELVQLILNTNKPTLLEKISQLLKQEKEADWWDEIPESVQESIEIAIGQANRDEKIPHSAVLKEARAKYGL